ncbi:MAG TPA: sigma factor, partial [Streptosporangiaceae bacterium]|nr:sigma factor [Streptosporangiaceae bacterium]
ADLVAATFVTVLTAARSYDPGRGEPGAWLLGIAARLIVNARRRKARESAALARIAGRRLIGPSDRAPGGAYRRRPVQPGRDRGARTAPAPRPRGPAAGQRGGTTARRARPSGRRRVAVTLVAGAAAAGIAAASIAAGGAAKPAQHATGTTGTAAGGAAHGHGASGSTAQTATSPKLHTAAYVVDHLSSALNANTAVVDIVDHAPDSQTGKPVLDEIWSSSLSDTYRIVDMTPAGQPTTGYLVTVKPHRTTSIVIDYGNRTWRKTIYPFGSSSDGRRAAGPAPSTPLQLAAQLRAKVKAGQVTLVGWATADGQRAIHLREGMTHGQVNLWVDPDSYLPIREIDTAPGVSQTSDQAIRDDYRWLPATKANLRLLTPAWDGCFGPR